MAAEIAIIQQYRSYDPPIDIAPCVRLLLRYVPNEYLSGLRTVVLTNSTGSRELRRGKTWSRGRKVGMTKCLGFYCGDRIELLVDNILAGLPRECCLPAARCGLRSRTQGTSSSAPFCRATRSCRGGVRASRWNSSERPFADRKGIRSGHTAEEAGRKARCRWADRSSGTAG